MRALLLLGPVAGLVLAGCSQSVPDSNLTSSSPDLTSAPLGTYAAYELERARREALLTGAPPGALVTPVGAAAPAPFLPVTPVAASPTPSGISTSDLAAAGIGGVGIAPLAADNALPGAFPAAVPGAFPSAFPAAVPGAVSGALPSTVPGDALPATVASVAPLPGALPAALPVAPAAAPVGTGTLTAPGTPATSPERPAWNPQADPLRDHGLEAQPGNAAPVLVAAPVADPAAAAGPNLVDYALAAPNTRGQEWYSRSVFNTAGRASRNCADYRTPDEAQRDFLSRGGPERDARGLDPDGDGFACGWDPAPFRAAVGR